MKTYILFFFAFLFSISAYARQAQTLEYKTLGITVTVPEGFMHQEGDGSLMMQSQSMPNALFILSMHEYSSLDELKIAAEEPFADEGGTYLAKNGALEEIGNDAVAGNFKGYAGGYPAEAYILGRLNPHGSGVTVLGVVANQMESMDKIRETVLTLNEGLSFAEREIGEIVDEWTQKVINARLQYTSNYSSVDYTDGGASVYSSSSETFDICGNGYFNYYGSSDISAGTNSGSVSGYGDSSSQGNGSWNIDVDADGTPLLVLTYNNGNSEQYTLYYEDGYLYMNDYKYTIGRGSEYGPNCY